MSILGDGATHVAAGGINPIAVVRATGQILLLRKGGGSTRLFAGDTLEIDGFKRSDSTKFPDGPAHAFSIVACAGDPPSPKVHQSSHDSRPDPDPEPEPDLTESSEIEHL